MSERNMRKNHISKDKIAVRNTREDDISKEKADKATKTAVKSGGKAIGTVKNAGTPKAMRTPKSGTQARNPEKSGGRPESNPAKPGMAQKIGMLLWILLCGVLLIRIWNLNQTIETLRDRLDKLTRLALEQRERLELFAESLEAGEDKTNLSGERTGSSKTAGGQTDSWDEAQSNGETGKTGAGGDFQGDDSEAKAAAEAAAVSGQGVAHKVYLTFDDGPSEYTQEILDILDKYGVKATFFVVGKEGSQAEENLRKIVEAGHTLGMHSYTHKYGEVYASIESFAADFEKEQDYLYEVTGVKSTVYRFPGGSSNTVSKIDMREFAEYLDSQGVRFFDWNISSGDGGSFLVPVETLIENCTATIKSHGTSVVLMHDAPGKTTTREALPTIIETIQAMDDTVLLPITDDTELVQHIRWQEENRKDSSGGQ